MAPQRYAPARGTEIGLGRDRILLVAQLVADVRQQFGERDAVVGLAALLPLRHELRHAIEQQAAEAGVVLGEIVDLGRVLLRRRAVALRLAVEVGRALDLEGEVDLAQTAGRSSPAGCRPSAKSTKRSV